MVKFIKLLVLIAIAGFMFTSCNKDKVYSQRHEFEGYSWARLTEGKTITFSDIEIKDTSAIYDIYVTIRHTPYINDDQVSFSMILTSEDGISRQSSHTIKLKDRFGEKWKGEALGDLIDLKEKCRVMVSFPSVGKYTITLTNLGKYVSLTGIMDIGLEIKKTDLSNYKNAK